MSDSFFIPLAQWPQCVARAASQGFFDASSRRWFWEATLHVEREAKALGRLDRDFVFSVLMSGPSTGFLHEFAVKNPELHQRLVFSLVSSLHLPLPGGDKPFAWPVGLLPSLAAFSVLALPTLVLPKSWHNAWGLAALLCSVAVFFLVRTRLGSLPASVSAASHATGNAGLVSSCQAYVRAARLEAPPMLHPFMDAMLSDLEKVSRLDDSRWEPRVRKVIGDACRKHIPALVAEMVLLPPVRAQGLSREYLSQARSIAGLVRSEVQLLLWLESIEVSAKTRYLNSITTWKAELDECKQDTGLSRPAGTHRIGSQS